MSTAPKQHQPSTGGTEPGAVTLADTGCFQQQYWSVSVLHPWQNKLWAGLLLRCKTTFNTPTALRCTWADKPPHA